MFASLGARLDRLDADDLTLEWPFLLGVVGVVAVVLLGLCRLVQAYTVGSASIAVGLTGAAVVVSVALFCLVMLGWLYWRTRLDTGALSKYLVALGVSIIALGVCVEAFAGVTTVLWRHGALQTRMPTAPGLWPAEDYYLWQLVNSVPLLAIPRTLGWASPVPFTGPTAGALVLAFKVVLIAPLVRVAVGAYQLLEAHRLADAAKRRDEEQRGLRGRLTLFLTPTPSTAVLLSLRAAAVGAASLAILWSAVAPGSPFRDWYGAHRDHWYVRWSGAAVPWLALALVTWLVWATFRRAADDELSRADRLATMVGAGLAYLFLAALAIIAAAGWALALVQVGVARISPGVSDAGELRAVLTSYAWHVLDALPGPDIPQTLGLALDHQVTGFGAGALLLLAEMTVFGILIFPVARGLRWFAQLARPRPAVQALLPAAAAFAEGLATTRAAIEAYERAAFEPPTPPPLPAEPGPRLTPLPYRKLPKIVGWNAVRNLVAQLDRVTALFGTGLVAAAAEAAVAAQRAWYDKVDEVALKFQYGTPGLPALLMSGRRRIREKSPREQLDDLRGEADARVAAYLEAATSVLRELA